MRIRGVRSPWVAVVLLVVLTAAASAGSILTAPVSTASRQARADAQHQGTELSISPTAPAQLPTTTTSVAAGEYPSVLLRAADEFNQIAVAHGDLLLSGASASTASRVNPSCVSAVVDPAPLAVEPATAVDCNDPAVDGGTVAEVNSYSPDSNNATIRIARVDPRTGQKSVGPVVMTYGSYSDTRPVTASGGGWFWIYDNSTTQGAEVLQVSMSSGQVVQTVAMPTLYRPLLTADHDGLWIGNSIEGGVCSGCSPPSALYYLAPGSQKAAVVVPASSLLVCWLIGSGDHLWVGMGRQYTGCTKETIWRFDGSDFQPVFEVPDQGYDPDTVIGDESDGLWTMLWQWPPTALPPTSPRPQEIVHINPDTGAERVVATLPPLTIPIGQGEYGLLPGQAAVLGESMYLLEPPFRVNGYLGYSILVRVPLP